VVAFVHLLGQSVAAKLGLMALCGLHDSSVVSSMVA